jgi:hypothetical protein
MQVVHTVKLSAEEKEALLKLAVKIGTVQESAAYTPEEKVKLIKDHTDWFHSLLCDYIHDAFTYGYNEGENMANVKDTEMYKPTV